MRHWRVGKKALLPRPAGRLYIHADASGREMDKSEEDRISIASALAVAGVLQWSVQ